MQKRVEAQITGRVQMVMFRDFAQRKAQDLHLSGSVQNMPDRSVRVIAEGEEEKLRKFLTLLHKGSILAKVEDVKVEWLPATGKFQNYFLMTPTCVGIIMDGSRRFAKARGLPLLEGHRQGYEKLKEVLKWADEAGVEHMVVYAFSTENWRRAEEEVGYLVDLLRRVLAAKEIEEMREKGVRVRIVGEREKFAQDIQEGIERMEEGTKAGKKTLWVALSYGGRAEILNAVKKLARETIGKKTAEDFSKITSEITEAEFQKFLWTAEMPDPDLIIRTGGEMRLSNFLPWQSVYSELFFTPTLWPDFSREEFEKILQEYAGRERRNGR